MFIVVTSFGNDFIMNHFFKREKMGRYSKNKPLSVDNGYYGLRCSFTLLRQFCYSTAVHTISIYY